MQGHMILTSVFALTHTCMCTLHKMKTKRKQFVDCDLATKTLSLNGTFNYQDFIQVYHGCVPTVQYASNRAAVGGTQQLKARLLVHLLRRRGTDTCCQNASWWIIVFSAELDKWHDDNGDCHSKSRYVKNRHTDTPLDCRLGNFSR